MNKPSNKYFAAANSYNGFVSYFAKIFCSKDFDRIYVLKGGPGTGKSSFMKKIKEELSHPECGIDEIYCSSDPNSLDGIIIKHKERKTAILDGTAPHERDAVIPGAVDEIINLGEGWKKEFLIAQRDKILEIGQEKSNAYSVAYSYLKIAGATDRFIIDEYKKNFLINEAKTKAEAIFAEIPKAKSLEKTSSALIAIMQPLITKAKKIKSVINAPTNPSSSHSIANIISFAGSET